MGGIMKKGALIALALAIVLTPAGYALAAERTVVLTLPDMT
jgi:hypothetical protein